MQATQRVMTICVRGLHTPKGRNVSASARAYEDSVKNYKIRMRLPRE